jgi:hypothetical protein
MKPMNVAAAVIANVRLGALAAVPAPDPEVVDSTPMPFSAWLFITRLLVLASEADGTIAHERSCCTNDRSLQLSG